MKNLFLIIDAIFGMEFLPPIKAIPEKRKQLRALIDQQFLNIFFGDGIKLVNTLKAKAKYIYNLNKKKGVDGKRLTCPCLIVQTLHPFGLLQCTSVYNTWIRQSRCQNFISITNNNDK